MATGTSSGLNKSKVKKPSALSILFFATAKLKHPETRGGCELSTNVSLDYSPCCSLQRGTEYAGRWVGEGQRGGDSTYLLFEFLQETDDANSLGDRIIHQLCHSPAFPLNVLPGGRGGFFSCL